MHATDASVQTSTSSAADVARQLLDLWAVCMRAGGNQATYALFSELDLSLTQMKALHMLESCSQELSVKELSERLAMSMPNASRLAESLQQRGWAERREDEHDRRVKRVRITADGHEVVRRINAARLEGLESFTASLTDTQRRRLSGALAALNLQED
jgi:DNA-binding MarR family transcriptional regulator